MKPNISAPPNSENTDPRVPAASQHSRLIELWQTDFPLNARTLVFCFLSGSIWSIPVGLLVVARWEVFAAPLWTAPLYLVTVTAALLVLPLWSCFGFRDQPWLRLAGMAFTPCAIALAVVVSRIPGPN